MLSNLFHKMALKRGYIKNEEITRDLTCAWCGGHFPWKGELGAYYPLFCSKNHRRASSMARTKRRQAQEATEQATPKKVPTLPRKVIVEEPIDLNLVGRCPTPFKQVHATFEAAHEVIERVDPSMHAYKCVCSGIHIGHRNKKK